MASLLFDKRNEQASGAEFSDCGRFRYLLWRNWNFVERPRLVCFIGVNPSIADEVDPDRTITREVNFAKSWGFDGMFKLNAFAFIETKLKQKLTAQHIGEKNDATILARVSAGDLIVAAWGAQCPEWREKQLIELIGSELYCFGRTKHGRPKHPLYLPSDTRPELFWSPTKATHDGGGG